MYRALYAHNSQLAKYLSFQPGDKFTLVDTSVSDQWFLAQNGLGEIGYVPFNYIKKVEATIDQQVKFIDGAIEAIHLQATGEQGGQLTQEQRLIMKKLVKHRAEVVKSARGSDIRSSGRRRPAPAPPTDTTTSSTTTYASVGGAAAGSGDTSWGEHGGVIKSQSAAENKGRPTSQEVKSHSNAGKSRSSGHSRTPSAQSEIVVVEKKRPLEEKSVKKSKSVTSSIGQAPSIVSSHSSIASEVTTTSASNNLNESQVSNGSSNPFGDDDGSDCEQEVTEKHAGAVTPVSDAQSSLSGQAEVTKPNGADNDDADYDSTKNPFADEEEDGGDTQIVSSPNASCSQVEGHAPTTNTKISDKQLSSSDTKSNGAETQPSIKTQQIEVNNEFNHHRSENNQAGRKTTNNDAIYENCKTASDSVVTVSSSSNVKQNEHFYAVCKTSTSSDATATVSKPIDDEDLPPPPPEVYDDISFEQFEGDELELPPAPPDLVPPATSEPEQTLRVDDTYDVNLNNDIMELCGRPSIEECVCDDFKPKFDVKGKFFASHSLELPPERRLNITSKDGQVTKEASRVYSSLLKCQVGGGGAGSRGSSSSSGVPTPERMLELAQAHCVAVTHGDCEEMIGEFRKVTNLSHEESHWAILSAMNLLAAKVPHIRPSLEAVGLRFNMARECRSTGRDYQSEDALLLDSLTSELSDVTHDAQQRGHYLRDDLDSIIDMVTNLNETLCNAKHCVSVTAIQKDDFNLVELIAKYYQMETRWVIHSCLLQLIETVCRLNPDAIQEFLYSELPQEMVSEMQQHHNDDNRLLQVAKTLGVIFMKGLPAPHKLHLSIDVHFFIWLLGVSENLSEMNRPSDVDTLLALVCAWLLQYDGGSDATDQPAGSPGCHDNPLMDAFKMAQGHALLSAALCFLSKHDDPTCLLESVASPRVNSVILLLTHLFDSPDTADLLYTNDVEALVGIFEEFLRDLAPDDPLRLPMLHLVENFLRCYPDTASLRPILSSRLGPLLINIRQEKEAIVRLLATRILEDNSTVFEDI